MQYVYVVRKGARYKLGFTRSLARRLLRLRPDEVIITIEVPRNRHPSQLEYLINNRFNHKRLPSQGNEPGDKREWFDFDDDDLAWLRGFAIHCADNLHRRPAPTI